jgi:hypothetical protein
MLLGNTSPLMALFNVSISSFDGSRQPGTLAQCAWGTSSALQSQLPDRLAHGTLA